MTSSNVLFCLSNKLKYIHFNPVYSNIPTVYLVCASISRRVGAILKANVGNIKYWVKSFLFCLLYFVWSILSFSAYMHVCVCISVGVSGSLVVIR